MSINYYLVKSVQRSQPAATQNQLMRLHIGLDSAGWNFALHAYPDKGISTWADWLDVFEQNSDLQIIDEYGLPVPVSEFIDIVTKRQPLSSPFSKEFLKRNQCTVSEYGLASAYLDLEAISSLATCPAQRVTTGCISHGEGTWEMLIGDFE